MSRRKKEFECGNLDNVDPNNELRSWLVQNEYIRFGPTRGAPYTHTFLNGGTALIPDDKHEIFLQFMASELDSGRKWSVHEQATRFARLFFDFDIEELQYQGNEEINLAQIRLWTTTVQQAVLKFFPGAKIHSKNPNKVSAIGGQVIVLAAPVCFVKRKAAAAKPRRSSATNSIQLAKDSQRLAIVQKVSSGKNPNQASVLAAMGREIVADEKTMRKTGLHLIFPNIVCDLNQMMDVRAHVVEELQANFDPPGDGDWSKIVDVQVYSHSCGIRMPGTCKVDTCSECRGDKKRTKFCNSCGGRPRQFVDRPYKPILVLTTTGTLGTRALRTLQNSTDFMLKWCTIRQVNAFETKPPFVAPADVRPWSGTRVFYEIQTPSKHNSSWANAKCMKATSAGSMQIGGETGKTGEKIPYGRSSGETIAYYGPEHEITGMVERFIQKYTYPQWSRVQVSETKHVLLPANGRYKQPSSIYYVKVCGDNSRYCLNVGREHASSSIYFVIKKDGIEQRCWSGKKTMEGRVASVPCSDFRSNTCEFLQYKMGQELMLRLFPETEESRFSGTAGFKTSSSIKVSVGETKDNLGYPSLAEVVADTERKRKAVSLCPMTPGRSKTPPPDENFFKKMRTASSGSFAHSDMQSDSDAIKTVQDNLQAHREVEFEKSPFNEKSSFDEKKVDIVDLARTSTGHVCPTLKKTSISQRRDNELRVSFSDREPPRNMDDYKRIFLKAQEDLCMEARYQIDQFLAK